ncbi:DUF6932 family protein [Emticicia oligotrophica]|uniref:DUF6932 family protein n=1 Tax=Emticicia oligotrophica TaxID=312279 RepID=UPI00273B5A0A|nr:hypothetical protein [Emticicia oligotrophica]
MLQFDSNGNLHPPQIIETDFNTFKKIFVDTVEGSRTRTLIFEQYLDYINDLKALLNAPFYQWIDGSFVSKKKNPNDIDLVTFIEKDIFQTKTKEIRDFRKLRFHSQSKIDGYFIEILPETDENYFNYEIDRQEWFYTFSTTRSFHNKGILQVNF